MIEKTLIYKLFKLEYDIPMSEKKTRFIAVCVVVLLFLPIAGLISQERTNIAVIPMKNQSGLPEYTTLCETVTDTVSSVIRFLPDYTLYEASDNPDLLTVDTTNLETLKQFGTENSYDEILYGYLTKNDQEQLLFRLQIYDRHEHDIIVEESAVAESLLDVFDTADLMTLDLLGQITDINIGFGTIELIKTDGDGTYEVFLNKKKIRNPKKHFDKVLNGEYVLEIHQDRLLGDTVIYSNRIYVNEFQTTTVRFSIPRATEEELRFILIRNSEMLETASDPANLDRFLEEIAEFQELTKDIHYDPELVQLKDTIIEELGDRASFLLEEIMEEADESYYAEEPDFESANQTYSRISRLVNPNYAYAYAEIRGTKEIHSPREVALSADGTVYVLDGETRPRLSSFGPGNTHIASRNLTELDAEQENISLAADDEGNCFVYVQGTPFVNRYTAELTEPIQLGIPDFTPDPSENLFIAVSRGNAVYLIGNTQALVFEFTTGNELYIERDNVVEQSLQVILEKYAGNQLSAVFFDEDNILHLFFPSLGTLVQLTALGEPRSEIQFQGVHEGVHIAVDGLGYYYFTFPEEHLLRKYSPKGELVSEFGTLGKKDGEFNTPKGIAADMEGTVFVADSMNNRLQVLSLTAPPLLLPEVTQYGESFSRRTESSTDAVKRFEKVQTGKSILWTTAKFVLPLGIMASSFGLSYLDGIFYRNSMFALADFESLPYSAENEELIQQSNSNMAVARLFRYGGYAVMGAGSYWLADSITKTIDTAVQKKRTIRYLQSFDMDKDYIVDEEKFRSPQTAFILGLTTGLLPPLVGGATTLALSLIPSVSPEISHLVSACFIAIPPIFAYTYGGQISWGNFVTGILADLLAVTSYFMARSEHQKIYYESIENYADRGQQYMDESFSYAFSNYFLFGALVMRFVAGFRDFQEGWKRVNEYNTFEAVIERPSPLSMDIVPYIDKNGAPGLAFSLQM